VDLLGTLFSDLTRVSVEPGFDGIVLVFMASPAGPFFKMLLEGTVVTLLVGTLLFLLVSEVREAFEAVPLDGKGAAFAEDEDSLTFFSFFLPPQKRQPLRFFPESVSPSALFPMV
jgi:hypothetical protein